MTDKYGHAAFRYYLLREMPFGLDANFTEEGLVGRLNADLANDLGNLASRATTMIVSFGGGAVPAATTPGPEDAAIRDAVARTARAVDETMAEFAFHRALGAIWELIGELNRYVDAMAPWALAKDPARRGRLDAVLYTLGESLRALGILLDPFVPEAAAKIRAALGTPAPALRDLAWGGLAPGSVVQRISALFPRVDAKAAAPASVPAAATGAPKISLDEFARVDLRVAEVIAAENVPRSKKLLKLTVTVAGETRTLVAGVAEHYRPDELVGRKVVIVANLQPATLMGIESNGMVLAASQDGTLALLTTDKDVPGGAKVK
jgi:methionyl-tRNA synthetase